MNVVIAVKKEEGGKNENSFDTVQAMAFSFYEKISDFEFRFGSSFNWVYFKKIVTITFAPTLQYQVTLLTLPSIY